MTDLPKVDPEYFTTRGQVRGNIAAAAKLLRIALDMNRMANEASYPDAEVLTAEEADALGQHATAVTEFVASIPKERPS